MLKKVLVCVAGLLLLAAAAWFLNRAEEPFRRLEASEIDDPAQLDELHLYRIVPYRGQALGS
jgi:hypothetical protein